MGFIAVILVSRLSSSESDLFIKLDVDCTFYLCIYLLNYFNSPLSSVLFNSIQRSEMSSDGILDGGGVKFGMKDPNFQHVGPQLSDIRLSGKLVLGGAAF